VQPFFQIDLIGIMFGYILHPPANFIRERKKVKQENDGYLQKSYHNCTNANNYKHLALSKTKKQMEGA